MTPRKILAALLLLALATLGLVAVLASDHPSGPGCLVTPPPEPPPEDATTSPAPDPDGGSTGPR